ncbi:MULTISPECIES: O-succinylhomoserine sulfhydrylase [unclassified Guyparkeria]|uniref:O-succinylhomoserine sulfhydrylase n=1 Tax=unclassified Guyparkeria TaxID=2626246 RepID=UPI0007335570|nr:MULTISPECIES: O-succinylhomoserine sulfhydrylase [unclassified Guyparkeria]KTG17579.1 O-succinylhomoserine sulfhydrylase [Guyparkeria sp. XI15]OAE88392.1 O-succinylhomoserine sulfhydrylase [Guyparkeria sp. WRN-7]
MTDSNRRPENDWSLATQAIRTGHHPTPEREHGEPIFTTSSFTFESAEQAAARFAGDEPGNIYARFTNPTTRIFEERLAVMEGGEDCVATASGMSAILSTVMALCEAGDEVVIARQVFGTTKVLFDKYMAKFGLVVHWVNLTDWSQWEAAVGERTRMLFIETPSNPLTEVADIRRLADLAHARDAALVVDNCFCTPALQRPLTLGADIVIHSATKFLDGQGRAIGGAVVGDAERVGKEVRGFLRTCGPTMAPFNAWIFAKGLETLNLRMEAHSRHAREVADWLVAHPSVARVHFPGLPDHPQAEIIAAQQTGPGAIVSFVVEGGREAAWKVINGTRMLSITANLGDTKTTITHPASTTHGRLSPEARAEAGIDEGLVRLSVGLEDPQDIIADLTRGLGEQID